MQSPNPATGLVPTVSRVYANACMELGDSWYEYDDLDINWGRQEQYEIMTRLGRGKYSEVFSAVDLETSKKVVIKVLRPIKKKKIKRELKMLQNLSGGPNVIRLLDIVRDPVARTPAIIFEHIDNIDSKVLYPQLTDGDIQHYIYQLLRALDFCHSKGIVHRDVKPLNILIDHSTRTLRLIDYGLAEFYWPNGELNVRVASRYYKGPELLTDYVYYDYSLDLWSVGCTFGSMIFRKDPLFHGNDNFDQLVKIAKVLGTAKLIQYLDKYKIQLDPELERLIHDWPVKPWSGFVTNDNAKLVSNQAIDLLDKLLLYDHTARLTAAEAMAHPYFADVRRAEKQRADEEKKAKKAKKTHQREPIRATFLTEAGEQVVDVE